MPVLCLVVRSPGLGLKWVGGSDQKMGGLGRVWTPSPLGAVFFGGVSGSKSGFVAGMVSSERSTLDYATAECPVLIGE